MTLIMELYGNSPRLQFINPVLANNSKLVLVSDLVRKLFSCPTKNKKRETYLPHESTLLSLLEVIVFSFLIRFHRNCTF